MMWASQRVLTTHFINAYKNNENAAENSATDSSDETDNEKKKNEDVVDADFEEIKPEDDKKNAS